MLLLVVVVMLVSLVAGVGGGGGGTRGDGDWCMWWWWCSVATAVGTLKVTCITQCANAAIGGRGVLVFTFIFHFSTLSHDALAMLLDLEGGAHTHTHRRTTNTHAQHDLEASRTETRASQHGSTTATHHELQTRNSVSIGADTVVSGVRRLHADVVQHDDRLVVPATRVPEQPRRGTRADR
jgi:hypothetical protein